jgi:hypothetical protein
MAKSAEAGKGAGAMQVGLKMHGHWVIDVKNPDGTIVEHRDFENGITNGGGAFLIGLMSGYVVPGDYGIWMGPASGASPCAAAGPSCLIVRSLATYPGTFYCSSCLCATGLTVTPNFGANGLNGPASLVLAGSITANQAGTIGQVETIFSSCANIAFTNSGNPTSMETSSPTACVPQTAQEPFLGPMSAVGLTPVSVANGQIIQVTVTITFS